MKTIFTLLIVVFAATNATAQKDTPLKLLMLDNEKMKREIDSSMRELDSMNARINNSYKSMDSAYMQRQIEQNNRNLDSFMAMQREREAKQKRSNWIRIGTGAIFLGVLIFGLIRKRKKK